MKIKAFSKTGFLNGETRFLARNGVFCEVGKATVWEKKGDKNINVSWPLALQAEDGRRRNII